MPLLQAHWVVEQGMARFINLLSLIHSFIYLKGWRTGAELADDKARCEFDAGCMEANCSATELTDAILSLI